MPQDLLIGMVLIMSLAAIVFAVLVWAKIRWRGDVRRYEIRMFAYLMPLFLIVSGAQAWLIWDGRVFVYAAMLGIPGVILTWYCFTVAGAQLVVLALAWRSLNGARGSERNRYHRAGGMAAR